MKPALYFIAIVLPEPTQSEITNYKLEMLHRYGCKVALKSPAHITLVPPFNFHVNNENALLEFIMNFNSVSKPFQVSLKNFGRFSHRTIFINVEHNEILNQQQKKLNMAFSDFISVYSTKTKENDRAFYPHVTIANRDIERLHFDEAWLHYQTKTYSALFETESITLLKHDGNKWIEIDFRNQK